MTDHRSSKKSVLIHLKNLIVDFDFSVLFLFSGIIVLSIYSYIIFLNGIQTGFSYFNFSFGLAKSNLIVFLFISIFLFFIKKILGKKSLFYFIFSFVFFLLFYIDVQTYLFFGRKLFLAYLVKFLSSNNDSTITLLYFETFFVLFFISVFISYMLFIFRKNPIYVIFAISLLVQIIPTNSNNVKYKYFTQNFIYLNASQIGYGLYKCNNNLPKMNKKEYIGKNEKPNIIVVFAESWSASDSYRTSRLNSNLDGFDKASYEGTLFMNMFSYTGSTDQAYVSFFNSIPAIKYSFDPKAYDPFFIKDNLINTLKKHNYSTFFYKAYTLNFLGLRRYLSFLGFDRSLGKEEFFNKPPFYVFDSVSDEAVYNKVLTDVQSTFAPYFMVITTLSTHIPYITPYGNGAENAYRYGADSFYTFYKKLKKTGFFSNGYLIVFGDHRKMTVVDDLEYLKYKDSSYGRVACAIWGKDIKASIDKNYYNLIDISNSIRYLVDTKFSSFPFNNIFSKRIDRDFTIHAPYLKNDDIDIFWKNGYINHIKLSLDGSAKCKHTDKRCLQAVSYINSIRDFYCKEKKRH